MESTKFYFYYPKNPNYVDMIDDLYNYDCKKKCKSFMTFSDAKKCYEQCDKLELNKNKVVAYLSLGTVDSNLHGIVYTDVSTESINDDKLDLIKTVITSKPMSISDIKLQSEPIYLGDFFTPEEHKKIGKTICKYIKNTYTSPSYKTGYDITPTPRIIEEECRNIYGDNIEKINKCIGDFGCLTDTMGDNPSQQRFMRHHTKGKFPNDIPSNVCCKRSFKAVAKGALTAERLYKLIGAMTPDQIRNMLKQQDLKKTEQLRMTVNFTQSFDNLDKILQSIEEKDLFINDVHKKMVINILSECLEYLISDKTLSDIKNIDLKGIDIGEDIIDLEDIDLENIDLDIDTNQKGGKACDSKRFPLSLLCWVANKTKRTITWALGFIKSFTKWLIFHPNTILWLLGYILSYAAETLFVNCTIRNESILTLPKDEYDTLKTAHSIYMQDIQSMEDFYMTRNHLDIIDKMCGLTIIPVLLSLTNTMIIPYIESIPYVGLMTSAITPFINIIVTKFALWITRRMMFFTLYHIGNLMSFGFSKLLINRIFGYKKGLIKKGVINSAKLLPYTFNIIAYSKYISFIYMGIFDIGLFHKICYEKRKIIYKADPTTINLYLDSLKDIIPQEIKDKFLSLENIPIPYAISSSAKFLFKTADIIVDSVKTSINADATAYIIKNYMPNFNPYSSFE